LSTPIKNDVYAFIYMRDIDTRKKWELELDCRIERDKNTTLYLPQTMEAMTEHIIKSLKRGSLCAFMLFDMTKLPAIKESNAPVVVWRILASTSRLFKIILDSKYIVGRTSEDKVAVFLPTVKSIEDVESHAKYFLETIEHMRKKAGINEDLGYAVGISVSDSDKASYNSMYENSLAALGDSNEKISFFKNKNLKRSAIPFEQNGNYLLLKPDNDSADEDRDFAFSLYQCCAALIKGDNFKESLKEASTIILKYYNATRVFSLKYFKPNKILTIIGEISIDNSTSIWHSSQNIPLSAFPFLENISAKSQSVLISSEINSQNPTVNFIVSPIIIEGDLRGFICIENPLLHSNVTSLMNSIIPIIAKEFERRTETQKVLNLCNLDTMTGLYNRSNFYKTLSEINISSVISLGLLCSDVNGLKKINKDFGTEYGDTILKFIADVFVKEFGVGNVFRISGDEFTVILLNCTYNSFVIKCNNLSAEINKKYGDRISVGYAWSEKDIMPHKMFENADSICRLAKQDYYRLSNDLMISKHNENKMEFCKIIKDGGFIVYLQPKANILTDEIYGAEALVRCNHPKLGFLTPEKFISDFEKYNIVRDLDFFVLEFTFKLMMSWKKEFGRFIPVSVNFSRQTLIDPSAVDALKLLLLKYEVPASFIEIEITETIGDVERTTASAACERLLSLGFKLALDDFGSAYSSLSVLSNVKFDTVKLDKSLINDIVSNKESYIIAENVVLMCKKLGSSCIAEGVETPEQIAALKSINCNLAQGYYYNKPIPSNEFTKKYIALNDTEKKD
ncbi:MAG: bifunctional diguanylate cyclase/phosphodiesterase, partial [Clostridia bacterium]